MKFTWLQESWSSNVAPVEFIGELLGFVCGSDGIISGVLLSESRVRVVHADKLTFYEPISEQQPASTPAAPAAGDARELASRLEIELVAPHSAARVSAGKRFTCKIALEAAQRHIQGAYQLALDYGWKMDRPASVFLREILEEHILHKLPKKNPIPGQRYRIVCTDAQGRSGKQPGFDETFVGLPSADKGSLEKLCNEYAHDRRNSVAATYVVVPEDYKLQVCK